MGSREKDQTTPRHPPVISSLVVRPTDSGGGGRGPTTGSGGDLAAGSDYEPGFRMHAGSASPVRRRNADHRYSPDFDHSRGLPRTRGFGSARDTDRYRDISPPFGRRDGSKFSGRPFGGPGIGRPFRSEGMPKNNSNVRPREGDWTCPDPLCNNLNFARREYCNNCHRSRYTPVRSPRRGYPGPPLRRTPGPPMDRSPMRGLNGYRSPPRGWPRDGPRDFALGGPPHPRHESRFPDHHMRRERLDFPEDFYRERNRLDRPVQVNWGLGVRGRDSFFNERRPPPSPPPTLPPPRGRWAHDIRERSRSPIRGVPPPKDYHRDVYVERARDDRRVMGRDRVLNF